MKIEIHSLEELLIDGVNVGPVVVAAAERSLDASSVQAALYEWRDDLLREKAAELQDQQIKHNGELSGRDDLISDLITHRDQARARVAELEDTVQALNTTTTISG